MKSIREDLGSNLDKIERGWIRKPSIIIITILTIPLGAIIGAIEGAYKLTKSIYDDCWEIK